MRATLLGLLLLLQDSAPGGSEPPKITLEKTGEFHALVKEIADKVGVRIHVEVQVDKKQVKAAIKDAGLFEALDALCKLHGEARLFDRSNDRFSDREKVLTVSSGARLNCPAQYPDHYMVVVTRMTRVRMISTSGESSCINVDFALMAPPWQNIDFGSGSRTDWSLTEAVNADGASVLAGPGQGRGAIPYPVINPRFEAAISGNSEWRDFTLLDFDLDKGLKSLAGKISMRVADSKVVRVPLEIGKEVAVPNGAITVDSMTEFDKEEGESRWRLGFTFKPAKADGRLNLERYFESRIRVEGADQWEYERFEDRKGSFEVETYSIPGAPTWVEFRARTGEKKVEVPFRFEDVRLKE